jgi:hypothetical protein
MLFILANIQTLALTSPTRSVTTSIKQKHLRQRTNGLLKFSRYENEPYLRLSQFFKAFSLFRINYDDHLPNSCALLLLGGSNTTVTLRFPQAGHMRRVSSLDNGKFGLRVQTNVSTL